MRKYRDVKLDTELEMDDEIFVDDEDAEEIEIIGGADAAVELETDASEALEGSENPEDGEEPELVTVGEMDEIQ